MMQITSCAKKYFFLCCPINFNDNKDNDFSDDKKIYNNNETEKQKHLTIRVVK